MNGNTRTDVRRDPTPPSSYVEHGLGPLPPDAEGGALYLDLIKRALANILYEDVPSWVFDRAKKKITAGGGFQLDKRVTGEDGPTAAHTMIGIRRLENLQYCIENILKDNVPGDFVETGVLSGGATIFMRAVLKARMDTTRRVFVCDSFMGQPTTHPPKVLQWVLKAAASVPDKTFRLELFRLLQRAVKSAPPTSEPSEQLVDFVMQILQNGDRMPLPTRDTSLDGVQSNFARYGLLDDQVVFAKGYFADTLPEIDSQTLALIRLDGDLYESTITALDNLYPKLSKGGYCIIDDFFSFTDCRQAVEEYRAKNKIHEVVETIDHDAVFWRKL